MFVLKNQDVAKYVNDTLIQCGADLDSSIAYIKENCTEEEFEACRPVIGKIMGEIVVECLMPLYHHHPDIDPDK